MARRTIVVVATDPVTERMPGPAIRAWHLAEVLSSSHDVVLASTVAATRTHDAFEVVDISASDRRRRLEEWADILIVPAGVLWDWPELASTSKVAVVDLYDPYHLENLEPGDDATIDERGRRVSELTAAIGQHLEFGDFFLCATERQRDFWLGSLAAMGRVNPRTYDQDPLLKKLIAVVPFGVPAVAPERQRPRLKGVIPGIGERDKVILWAGGVYNWFDPVPLIRAVDRLSVRMPEVRLVFLGMQHPNPTIPTMRVAAEARAISDELGLTGKVVYFQEGWVPYDERGDYLLDADVGVSTHLDHIETRYSFRTRVLDYLWAGLPMVVTQGDVLADLVSRQGLGSAVPPSDEAALDAALEATLRGERPTAERFATATASLTWPIVAGPLVAFCDEASRAADSGPRLARPGSDGRGPDYNPAVESMRSKARSARERLVGPIADRVARETADRMIQPVLAQAAELQRIVGDHGDAADEVAEVIGRTLTRLSAEVDALTAEVARLEERLDRSEPPS